LVLLLTFNVGQNELPGTTRSSCTHLSIGIDSVTTLSLLGGALPSIAL